MDRTTAWKRTWMKRMGWWPLHLQPKKVVDEISFSNLFVIYLPSWWWLDSKLNGCRWIWLFWSFTTSWQLQKNHKACNYTLENAISIVKRKSKFHGKRLKKWSLYFLDPFLGFTLKTVLGIHDWPLEPKITKCGDLL